MGAFHYLFPQHFVGSQYMMTDTRCERFCIFMTVLISALLIQLEYMECGCSWYASRDAMSMLTLDALDSKRYVSTDPRATAKFENVEKKLPTSRENGRMSNGIFMPPLSESHKSFGKSRKDENVGSFRTC